MMLALTPETEVCGQFVHLCQVEGWYEGPVHLSDISAKSIHGIP